MATIVQEYVSSDGRNHYREFFNSLAPQAAAKAATAVARMAAGNTSGLKGLGSGLAEWRIDWGPGIRLYVHQDGDQLVVMLGGSDKGNQSAEVTAAATLAAEYKERKKAAAKTAKEASKDAKVQTGKSTKRK
ncbi:type II toxin-antitoxin system RelE/ParE family toxin [Luteibacter sp. dw_328]|uniref:type II toxin-antitoxin system RelE/ParE family toxin n=1 Tax=Luteibacter sp. dw_328 TaxID=2719796 RepID=UPI001BD593EB|nr:type II toxin-antitoxin system RelE/ParE family toxin [Luteibacter sp. dw_328]